MDLEVLIVGGGPAGLSAALVLGRCHRKVLVCDDGQPRNRSSHAIHGLLGQEGSSPAAFLETARGELTKYPSVRFLKTRVENIAPSGDAFTFSCADGTKGKASKILLASGLVDELPLIAGVEDFYGNSVHHCLYCDGFEYRGKTVAAYGKEDKGAELGLMMRHWMSDVVVCCDGTEPSSALKARLAERGIPLRTEPVASLAGTDGKLSALKFKSGPSLECAGLFFATGCHQASDLSKRLGCERDARGGVVINEKTEESSVAGVYVAGDTSRDVLMVSVAIAEGAKAAVAINQAFLRRDGFCE